MSDPRSMHGAALGAERDRRLNRELDLLAAGDPIARARNLPERGSLEDRRRLAELKAQRATKART